VSIKRPRVPIAGSPDWTTYRRDTGERRTWPPQWRSRYGGAPWWHGHSVGKFRAALASGNCL